MSKADIISAYGRSMEQMLSDSGLSDPLAFVNECAVDFSFFYKFCLGLDLGKHHVKWIRYLTDPKFDRVCIMAARGHSKTETCSIAFPLWVCFRQARAGVVIISSSQEQANIILRRLKFYVDTNELLMGLKPTLSDAIWKSDEISFSNLSTIYARGFGTAIRGLHLDYVVMDDILRDDNKYSSEAINDFFYGTISPTVEAKNGKLFLIGTPQEYTDLFHQLRANPVYVCDSYPAVLDVDARVVLWPEHFDWDKLMRKRDEIGKLKFAREYNCTPLDDSTRLFPFSLLKSCYDESSGLSPLPREGFRYVIGVDLARSAAASADFSVYTVLEVDSKLNRRLVWLDRLKGCDSQHQVDRINELALRFNNAKCVVEENNIGVAFIDYLKEKGAWVISYRTSRQSKEDMILYLLNQFENHRIVIPRQGDNTVEVTDLLLDELMAFGVKKNAAGKERLEGLGSHDDQVMSLALANEGCREVEIEYASKWLRGGRL